MNSKAVPQANAGAKIGLVPAGLLAVMALAMAFTSTAAAAPAIGKGGQISACYLVKGKAKGAMRVVPAKKKCRKGERKLAWSVAGPPGGSGAAGPQGQSGANGGAGAKGDQGQAGATGAPNTGEAALETQIANLNIKIASLESILNGVTNTDLTAALKSIPQVEALCGQAKTLTTQSNLLGTAVGGLSLNGALTILGGVIDIPALPASLPAFTCPV